MARYPIGIQDFKTIREEGFLYVDKTPFIDILVKGSKYYFLSRPRRFGKSLFVSTLENFFSGNKELFRGLSVYNSDWNWEKYPVIRLDLGGARYDRPVSVQNILNDILSRYEKFYKVENRSNDIYTRFANLIIRAHETTGRKAVVLVDEYEKPILDAYDKEDLKVDFQETLRGFYSVLKSQDEHLQLVFLTGVTKFGKISVFSGLNNIYDISIDNRFASICGITESELESNFKEGINSLAQVENTDYKGALAILKKNYDGYHFSPDSPDIYNPFCLLQALDSSFISNYWSQSGTPSILVKILMETKYNLSNLDNIRISSDRLLNISTDHIDVVPLLYQTGYLTIKSYDREEREFILTYPNPEVEKSILEGLLKRYSTDYEQKDEQDISRIASLLKNGKIEEVMKILCSLTADISYDLVYPNEVERHFQNMFYIIFRLLGLKVQVERKTSSGRIDVVIQTSDFIYIMELKMDSSAEEAVKQIDLKNYTAPYKSLNKTIYKVGVSFSKETRDIRDYKIERE